MLISLSAALRKNGWTDLHEIFREGVEWPWDDVITFCVNSGKPRDAAMVTWQMTSRGIKRSRSLPLYLWSLIFQKPCDTDGYFKLTTHSTGQHILRNDWWCHLSQMVTVQGNPRSAHTSSPTGLYCVKTIKDRHVLSAALIFDRDCGFWRYKVCADIPLVSLEIRR